MEVARIGENDIVHRGASILRCNEFYRTFLELFDDESMQSFLKKQARSEAEWSSIRFFLKLRTYINDSLGHEADKETMAYYLNAIMKHPVLRRTAHAAVRDKRKLMKKKTLTDMSDFQKIAQDVVAETIL